MTSEGLWSAIRIDRNSPVPLYFQFEQHLRRQVQAGILKAGDAIPNEVTLQRLLGLSRTTIRQALAHLVSDGTVVRRKGTGTFVARPRDPLPLSCLMSLTREMLDQGRSIRTEILAFEKQEARPELRKELQLAWGMSVYYVRRLRWIDDSPACLVDSYIPSEIAPNLKPDDFEPTGFRQSLIYVLERIHGVQSARGEEWSESTFCTSQEAALLRTAGGAPIVRDICVIHDVYGVPILYEEAAWGTIVRRRVLRPNASAGSQNASKFSRKHLIT
jgi:GntR family transcriptional regulator